MSSPRASPRSRPSSPNGQMIGAQTASMRMPGGRIASRPASPILQVPTNSPTEAHSVPIPSSPKVSIPVISKTASPVLIKPGTPIVRTASPILPPPRMSSPISHSRPSSPKLPAPILPSTLSRPASPIFPTGVRAASPGRIPQSPVRKPSSPLQAPNAPRRVRPESPSISATPPRVIPFRLPESPVETPDSFHTAQPYTTLSADQKPISPRVPPLVGVDPRTWEPNHAPSTSQISSSRPASPVQPRTPWNPTLQTSQIPLDLNTSSGISATPEKKGIVMPTIPGAPVKAPQTPSAGRLSPIPFKIPEIPSSPKAPAQTRPASPKLLQPATMATPVSASVTRIPLPESPKMLTPIVLPMPASPKLLPPVTFQAPPVQFKPESPRLLAPVTFQAPPVQFKPESPRLLAPVAFQTPPVQFKPASPQVQSGATSSTQAAGSQFPMQLPGAQTSQIGNVFQAPFQPASPKFQVPETSSSFPSSLIAPASPKVQMPPTITATNTFPMHFQAQPSSIIPIPSSLPYPSAAQLNKIIHDRSNDAVDTASGYAVQTFTPSAQTYLRKLFESKKWNSIVDHLKRVDGGAKEFIDLHFDKGLALHDNLLSLLSPSRDDHACAEGLVDVIVRMVTPHDRDIAVSPITESDILDGLSKQNALEVAALLGFDTKVLEMLYNGNTEYTLYTTNSVIRGRPFIGHAQAAGLFNNGFPGYHATHGVIEAFWRFSYNFVVYLASLSEVDAGKVIDYIPTTPMEYPHLLIKGVVKILSLVSGHMKARLGDRRTVTIMDLYDVLANPSWTGFRGLLLAMHSVYLNMQIGVKREQIRQYATQVHVPLQSEYVQENTVGYQNSLTALYSVVDTNALWYSLA